VRQTTQQLQPIHQLFQDFMANNPPQEFSNRLRRLLLEYMRKQMHAGFPIYFEDFLGSVSDLFDLLDEAAARQQAKINTENKSKDV